MDALITLILQYLVPAAIIAVVFSLVLFLLPREVRTIFKRELKAYFTSPIAYVLFVVFLGISNGLAFFFFKVLESGEADIFGPFFQWLPWYFVIIIPAVGMRLWSEEQRLGTMELVFTMPIAPWHAIVGKYLAAAVIVFLMLVLTCPIVWTVNYLGNPDNGVIFSGYVASLMLALSFLAVTSAVSAFTRSQIVAYLISLVIALVMVLGSFPDVVDLTMNLSGIGGFLAGLINKIGVWLHFSEMAKGNFQIRDFVFFLSIIGFSLFATAVALRVKRS